MPPKELTPSSPKPAPSWARRESLKRASSRSTAQICLDPKFEVVSAPTAFTICPIPRGYSSVGRASRSQCEGQGFDSPYLHSFGNQRAATCRQPGFGSREGLKPCRVPRIGIHTWDPPPIRTVSPFQGFSQFLSATRGCAAPRAVLCRPFRPQGPEGPPRWTRPKWPNSREPFQGSFAAAWDPRVACAPLWQPRAHVRNPVGIPRSVAVCGASRRGRSSQRSRPRDLYSV